MNLKTSFTSYLRNAESGFVAAENVSLGFCATETACSVLLVDYKRCWAQRCRVAGSEVQPSKCSEAAKDTSSWTLSQCPNCNENRKIPPVSQSGILIRNPANGYTVKKRIEEGVSRGTGSSLEMGSWLS
jgi:hypothetical protein